MIAHPYLLNYNNELQIINYLNLSIHHRVYTVPFAINAKQLFIEILDAGLNKSAIPAITIVHFHIGAQKNIVWKLQLTDNQNRATVQSVFLKFVHRSTTLTHFWSSRMVVHVMNPSRWKSLVYNCIHLPAYVQVKFGWHCKILQTAAQYKL